MTAKENQLNGFELFPLEYGSSGSSPPRKPSMPKYISPASIAIKNIIYVPFVL